jgi:inosine-uridine nucleoside N-ribohydrolase
MDRHVRRFAVALVLLAAFASSRLPEATAQVTAPPSSAPEKIVIDTDIGIDIDDAFAIGLALSSPEVQVLGFTTVSGDAGVRARLVDRMLHETGMSAIPVAAGPNVPGPFDEAGKPIAFTQARWAGASPWPARDWPAAEPFLRELIERYPGQITLVCLGPLSNVAALAERDPATFHRLKRIVMMGGAIDVGYAMGGHPPAPPAVAEYNVAVDAKAAATVFAAGVPIVMLPLDSTQVTLDQRRLDLLAAQGTALTDAVTLLYDEWAELNPWGRVPTLYDAVAMAEVIDPAICPTQPLHVIVDAAGFTRRAPGAPNAAVCLHEHADPFLDLVMTRLLNQRLHR